MVVYFDRAAGKAEIEGGALLRSGRRQELAVRAELAPFETLTAYFSGEPEGLALLPRRAPGGGREYAAELPQAAFREKSGVLKFAACRPSVATDAASRKVAVCTVEVPYEVEEAPPPEVRDVTAGDEEAGVKYLSDGTQEAVRFSYAARSTGNACRTVVDFTDADTAWVQYENGAKGYEIAFPPARTGMRDNGYFAELDLTYADGAVRTQCSLFKGTDGSLLLSGVRAPFTGRLILLGAQVAEVSAALAGLEYDAGENLLTAKRTDGSAFTVALDGVTRAVFEAALAERVSVSTTVGGMEHVMYREISGEISSGKHCYRGCHFTDVVLSGDAEVHFSDCCTGTVSFGTGTPTVYIDNSPEIAACFATRTFGNWKRVWVDGVASYVDFYDRAGSQKTEMRQDGGMVIRGLVVCRKGELGIQKIPYPQAFVDVPVVQLTAESAEEANLFWLPATENDPKTSLTVQKSGLDYNCFYTAAGRWR